MWNLGDPPASFDSTGPDGLPVPMSYQYPTGATGLGLPSNILPSYHPILDHTQSPFPSLSKATSPTLKNKIAAGINNSAKIRKSMSTPNVRGQASIDAAALALSAEKRRNKLGYHRTSVACGHCRRRKIRCIPAPADPQNRCSNCIRLKKECNFYPVDQQPPPEPRRRGSKAQSVHERQSESSSPSTSNSQLPEMPPIPPYTHLNMPQDLGGPQMKSQRTESFSPEHKGAIIPLKPHPESYPHPTIVTSSRKYEYPQSSQGHINWMAPEPSPGTKTQGDVPQTFWRPNPQDSPITPAFSPYTPGMNNPPPHNWPISQAESSPREETTWGPPPQRSISYSNIEGLQNQQHYSTYLNPAPPAMPEQFETKSRVLLSNNIYPPPISTSHHSSSGPASAPIYGQTDQHPHSANSLPPVPSYNWPPQNQHAPYPYQKPMSAGGENYGGWHPSPHGDHPPPPPPPPNYGYGDHNGVYYAPHHHGR